MADSDEAAIHSNDPSAPIETDLSDETQDFRFLNNLTFLSDPSNASLPRRGEKDFEPNPTLYQADVLAASRSAMHNALAHPRLHYPKARIIGVYAPDGPVSLPTKQNEESGAAKKTGSGPVIHPDSCVYVPNPKGQHFRTIGKADRRGRVWLLPEEALYLLERGSLDIRWPCSLVGEEGDDKDGDDEDGPSDLPMSLQAAYTCFIGRGGLALERYSVYTGLRRLGYVVLRAPGWCDEEEESGSEDTATGQGYAVGGGLFAKFWQWFYKSNTTASGPVAGLGIHRSYGDIYRRLALVPWYDPVTAASKQTTRTTPPFRVVFHVFKPSTPFKKTAIPPPDFRIAVINAGEHTSIPTLSELGVLLDSSPLDPPRGEKMDRLLYMRLRHGYRSVILAIVDQGVVSYLRMADSAFGKEKLYAQQGMNGPKKGGRPRKNRR